ncbi:hypothetical protein LdCL_170016600 [Leishmania donovani]|uniref:BTB domain-containing protein n=1 Tax=Leishmania donovani TaxID=5661 RepID=A0A3Q8ICV1_LEIDO|nr:hypothetical protein LdCL_170016600 [Leishmania donovani]
MAVSRSLSGVHTTATTVASASLPSTTGTTAAYCSTAQSYPLADAGHGTLGSVLGGVHDISASRSPPATATAEDAGAASLVSRLRAEAVSRKMPRLLRCHAMTPMLLSSGELMTWEQPVLSAASSLPAATAATATSVVSPPTPNAVPPASFFQTPPPPTPPTPVPQQQIQQRELRLLRCVRRSGVPLIEQLQQRCRTATGLTQRLVAPQRSPRASGDSAESPSHAAAAVVMRQPCDSLSAPLSPISFPFGGHSGPASMLGLHSSAELLSPGTRQLHWSKRGRVLAAPRASSDADDRQSPSARESGLLGSVRGGQQEESHSSAPGTRVSLREPSELSRDDHDRGMGTEDGALHRVSLSTPLLFLAPSSPSADADAAASSVASTAGTTLAHSTTEPAHDTCNLPRSYSRPSGTRYHPQTPRKGHTDVVPSHLVDHPLLSRPPPLSSAEAAQGLLCPPRNGRASATATAPHARDSRPLTFHSHEGGVPSLSPSRWPSTLQAHSSISLPSSAAGAAAVPLMSSAQPGPSPTMSQQQQQQQHSLLFAVLPTMSVIPSSRSMPGATTEMPAAGGSDSSTPPLVFTAIEPAAADMRSTSGAQYLSQEMQPASRSSSTASVFPHLAHGNGRGGSPARAFMLQQHPFSEPVVATSALATSLLPSRTATPPGIAGSSHDRIAHVDPSATTPRGTSDAAVVGSDRPRCAHPPHSHPPKGAVVAAAAVASAAASPSRSSVLRHQQPPPLLLKPAEGHHRPGMPPPLPSLSAMSHACETPSRRQQRPPAERRCVTTGGHARQPETAVGGTVRAAAEMMVVPFADMAMLLVVPGGVSSVPAASIAAMTGSSGDAPSWGSDTHADAALALIEDVVEGGSSEEGRLVAPGRRVGGDDGGAGSAETATEKVVTYFPIQKSVLAQRSAYFAALLDEGSGCGPYVRSTPDEYVDLTSLLPLPTIAEPAEARDAHLCRAGGAGGPCPMTARILSVWRRPDHLRRGPAAAKASEDAEPARSVATAHRQRVPVYYIPTPETVACFTDDSSGARLGRSGAHSRIGTGDPAAASTAPTLSHACVCQLLHYLHTGVLPIFYQLPGRTEVTERESTAAAGIASLQSDALRNGFANDYAAVLWMGLYTGLSSLTSSMLKLLWHFLALSRDVWPYWIAAAHWRVPEMQLICEAWIEQHLCAMLRASTAQGLWRGLRLDQVQMLVSLRKKALDAEAEARAAQASPMASNASPRYLRGRTTTVGGAAAEASMSTTTTTMPSFLREQMNDSDAASNVDDSVSVSEEAAEQRRAQFSLRPPAPPVATIGWPAEVLRYQQPHPLRLRGGSGSDSGVGTPSFSSSQPGAGRVSSVDNPRVSPTTEVVPVLSRDAEASPSRPPLESPSPFALPTPPSALAIPPALATPLAFDGVSSPGAMAGVASAPFSRQSSRASTPLFASSAAAAVRRFRGFSGRPAALRVATTTATPGIPSSAALTFDDLSGADGAQAAEGAGNTAAIAGGARGHRTDLGGGGESGAMMSGAGLTSRMETPSAANTAVAFRTLVTTGDAAVPRSEAADLPTLAQANIPARANAEMSRTTPFRSPLTTRGVHDLFNDSRAEPCSPSRLHVAYPPITSANAYYTTPPNGVAIQPTLQVLADGAWAIGGCGRLYTAETREELDKRQAYWYRAECEQQQQLPSAALLTETEVLERLWTWWRARTEDSSNQPTEMEVRAVVEMLQKVRLSDAQASLPCTSSRDDSAYDGFRALLDEEQRCPVASKVGLPNAAAATVQPPL